MMAPCSYCSGDFLHYVGILNCNNREETTVTETTYQQRVREAEAAVAAARGALGRDLAAAIAGKTWSAGLRDSFDARALIDRIDELVRDQSFLDSIRAAADKARGRGRPKKTVKTVKTVKSTMANTPARTTATVAVTAE